MCTVFLQHPPKFINLICLFIYNLMTYLATLLKLYLDSITILYLKHPPRFHLGLIIIVSSMYPLALAIV